MSPQYKYSRLLISYLQKWMDVPTLKTEQSVMESFITSTISSLNYA